jgi:CHAD domain-containing protein
MAVESRQFFLPKDIDVAKAFEDFGYPMLPSVEGVRSSRRYYYDSFDWRVYAANALLVREEANDVVKLHWQDRDGNANSVSGECDGEPGFAWNFPPGEVRDRLESVLEMRRLLPVMQLNTRIHNYQLENRDAKIILRLSIEHITAIDPDSKSRKRLPQRLHVQMLKGYSKPYRVLLKYLQHTLKLQPCAEDLLTQALASYGRKPGDYSSKPNYQLEANMCTDHAIREVLQHLLKIMEHNEAGVLADIDSEFLHDFRVACRRSRSIINQVKQVFPQRVVTRFRKEFAWLSQVSGPTRDLDVYLLSIPDYQASLPAAMRPDLEPLRGFLQQQQKSAHRQLVRALNSARYRRFKQSLHRYLASSLPARTTLANARRPVKAVANERIWRMFRRTIREGQSIAPNSPAEELHELRKTCKKLRYLLECFQSLYPSEKISRLIKALKGLQNNLGDFQDLHIQISRLQDFSAQMVRNEQAGEPTLMAMSMLIESLGQRQRQARKDFHVQFVKFATKKNRRLCRKLFAQQGKGSA